MSEPTYRAGTSRADWSQVYTGLGWVSGWMADRGYTDAEIAYVVGEPAVPAEPIAPFAPVALVDPVEPVVDVEVGPAPVTVPEVASEEAPTGADATEEPGRGESVPA